MSRKKECNWKASVVLYLLSMIVIVFWSVDSAHCETMTTFEGRIIDADTLKPIDGVLVGAIWSEWKGGGLLSKERFKDARECLTDREGKWSFQGLAGGTRANSDKRIILSYLTGYRHKPPHFFIYKNGYTGLGRSGPRFRGFVAWPYRNPKNGQEGIVLVKPGDTEAEIQAYREMNPHPYTVPFIPIAQPEKRLRALNFSFSYGPDTKIIPMEEKPIGGYVMYGLKKTTNAKEIGRGRLSLPIGACNKLPITCKNKHGYRPPVSSLPTVISSGGIIEETLRIEDKPDKPQ